MGVWGFRGLLRCRAALKGALRESIRDPNPKP